MSIPKQITDFLDSHQIAYQHCTHSPAFTAQGLAHIQHISGKLLAKVVMIMADDRIVMTVLPASHRVDLTVLPTLLNAKTVRLATENEFKDIFPDCELGAMPPFGNLYHIEVWVDEALRAHPTLTFNAGTHAETIQMNWIDFERLVLPHIGTFSILWH
jgi:Ala-tRNA(Pro) deacylase